MGAIQGAVNTALGAIAAGTVAAKKFGEQQEGLPIKMAQVKADIAKSELEIASGAEEIAGLQKQQQQIATGRNEKGQFRKKADVAKDLQKNKLALDYAKAKQEALVLTTNQRKQQFEKVRGRMK